MAETLKFPGMDKGSQNGLTLRRMPQGGFLVLDDAWFRSRDYDGGGPMQFHYACTTIDEALKFMREKVKPVEPEQGTAAKRK